MKLKNGNVLSRVTQYRLQRAGGGVIDIEVHEILNDGVDKKFVAHPRQLIPITQLKEEFIIYGDSESEVLEQLLCKIEDLKKEEIFPKKETTKP